VDQFLDGDIVHRDKLPLTFHNEQLETCCLRTLCFDVPKKDHPNEQFAKTLLVICNKSDKDREIQWKIELPPHHPVGWQSPRENALKPQWLSVAKNCCKDNCPAPGGDFLWWIRRPEKRASAAAN
jgi:hypothetical protein